MASRTCAFGHAAGFVVGHALGVFEVERRGSPGVEFARAADCRPTRRTSRCRSPWRGTASRCASTCASIISRIKSLAVDAVENPLAVAVDALPLLVHHFVVFEQVLANFEVALFDLLLGAFDAAADHAAFDRFAFLHAEAGEHVLDPLAGEDPHQVVFERQVEAAAAGIALATATAAELQVDAAGFVPLGADDVQAAELFDFLPFGLHLLALLDLA